MYDPESSWDNEKKQPRSRRKLIGKIDEETGEIVPTGGKGRSKKNSLTDLPNTLSDSRELETLCRKQADQIRQDELEISVLKKQVMELTLSVNEYKRRLSKIEELSRL